MTPYKPIPFIDRYCSEERDLIDKGIMTVFKCHSDIHIINSCEERDLIDKGIMTLTPSVVVFVGWYKTKKET